MAHRRLERGRRLMLGGFASFAQFGRDLVAVATTAGLAAARGAGTQLGRLSTVHREQVRLIHTLADVGRPSA
ncbi:MAG: hypothetical protein ABI083_01725 [Lapillicoccus sp.]